MSPGDRSPRYPLLFDLQGRAVLVVGGGPVAARRVTGLLRSGARVQVVAPQLCEDLADLVAAGTIVWSAREAGPGDVAAGPGDVDSGPRWWLVHTATGDPPTDAAIADAADRLGIWCIRADRAERSAAHVPAVAEGPDAVQVAVSGGGDPGRARAVRDAIALLLDSGALPVRRTRRTPAASTGRVVLVGGGPGDPGLLTVAGRQWLARADVVVTDRLGPTQVLSELDESVEIIDVGKAAGHHAVPQAEINRILVEQAQRGRTVVRLKGGDPFVLGRGGEEALHCLAHRVPVEVVPGVTSAISVPAAAGIPVTHRGTTASVVISSAHAGGTEVLAAARSGPSDATLVLLMGLAALAGTVDDLVRSGRPDSTPVAVISDGWSPRQRTVTGTLSTIASAVADAGLPGPAVIVVGEVVRLREDLRSLDHAEQAVGA
jgi:uroporphyrin-III C-methyltransferase/precorrin-2 dehydrogenase/sirohydrochlorin ferrochelatase